MGDVIKVVWGEWVCQHVTQNNLQGSTGQREPGCSTLLLQHPSGILQNEKYGFQLDLSLSIDLKWQLQTAHITDKMSEFFFIIYLPECCSEFFLCITQGCVISDIYGVGSSPVGHAFVLCTHPYINTYLFFNIITHTVRNMFSNLWCELSTKKAMVSWVNWEYKKWCQWRIYQEKV